MEPNVTSILDFDAKVAMHEKLMKNISLLMINSSQLQVNILEVSPEETTALTILYIPIFFIGFLGNITIVLIIGISPPLRNSTNWYLFNLAISDLLGFLGNITIVLIIGISPPLRNSTNWYLFNLAISDLFVTLICVPMAVGQALYRVWVYGNAMCKLTSYLQGATVAASIYTIAILSLDRFFAIKKPILFRRFGGVKYAVYAIIVVWVISLLLMTPLLFVKRVERYQLLDTDLQICVEIWPDQSYRQVYDIALFCFVYVVPGCVIGTAYSMIGMELWKEDINLQRRESVTSQCIGKHIMTGRKKVAKMLIALVIVFVICWLPYYIVSLYLDFHYDSPSAMRFMTVLPFVILLGHANSALNPLLYFYSSKTFRTYLSKIFRCLCCSNKKPPVVDHARFRYRSSRKFNSYPNGSFKEQAKNISSYNSIHRKSSTSSIRFSQSSIASSRKLGKSKKYNSSELTSGKMLLDNATLIQMKIIKATIENSNTGANGDVKRLGSGRYLNIPTTIKEESSTRGSLQCSPIDARCYESFSKQKSPVMSQVHEDIFIH